MNSLSLEAPVRAVPRRRATDRRLFVFVNGAALLVAALWLRTYHLASVPGINGDEAWSGVQALRLLRGEPVEWWTPTGNPINGFYFFPLVALHALAPPSFVLLRLVALASGLLALAANFALCRRAFGLRTAIVSTWLLALLPLDIAYSRFGWDSSQSLLATLVVMYLPLVPWRSHRRAAWLPTASALALAAAIWVHPTNVFAAPLLVVPLVYRFRRPIVETLQTTSVAAKPWTLAGMAAISVATVFGACTWLPQALPRLHGPGEVGRFAENYLRLFSGTTIYEYVSGAGLPGLSPAWSDYLPLVCDLGFGCAVIAALMGLRRRLASRPRARDEILVLGWFAMLLGFFLVAGPRALAPHFERYAVCLIAPGVLVISRGLTWWFDECPRRRHTWTTVLAVAAWLLPVSFYFGYFACFEQTGGRSHRTFRTAAVEPKLAAMRWILERPRPGEPVRIVCREWWIYWPLEYLSWGEQNVRIVPWHQWNDRADAPGDLVSEDDWFVEFAGTAEEADTLAHLKSAGFTASRHVIDDYAGRGVISVIGPAEKFSRNY